MVPTLSSTAPITISAEQEAALILVAKANDQTAMDMLIRAYLPAIRRAASSAASSRRLVPVDPEDAAQEATLTFIEAVHAHDADLGIRLAAYAPALMGHAVLRLQHGADQVSISPRTVSLFYSILRAADGDVEVARALAPDRGMRTETFLAAHRALSPAVSLSTPARATGEDGEAMSGPAAEAYSLEQSGQAGLPGALSSGDHADSIVEREYVAWLFTKVDPREAHALRLYYGFQDPATQALRLDHGYSIAADMTDDQVGHVLGIGRMTAQRLRVGALAKMKSAHDLALADEV